MAEEKKTKVRRIKANDSKKSQTAKVKKTAKAKKVRKINAPTWLKVIGKPFFAIGRYIRSSWQELRITKWPNRRATWSLTVAVLVFALVFAALILLVDFGFEWLMKEIIL